MTKKKFEFNFDKSNPFDWWGFILILVGVLMGGAIGAAIAAFFGYQILLFGKKKRSAQKKMGFAILFTFLAVITYIIVVNFLVLLFPGTFSFIYS